MCNHVLNKRGGHNKDALLGMEECQSPFGNYELKIPVDKNLACDADGMTNTNCKDLNVSYRKTHFFFQIAFCSLSRALRFMVNYDAFCSEARYL